MIPKDVREALKLKPGDRVEIRVEGGSYLNFNFYGFVDENIGIVDYFIYALLDYSLYFSEFSKLE